MVALGDVRRWDPAAVETALSQLTRARDELLDLDPGLAFRSVFDHWSGAAAHAAALARDQLAERLRRLTAGAAALRPTLVQAADAVVTLRRDLDNADRLAAATGLTIATDGSVADSPTAALARPGPASPAQTASARAATRAEIVAAVSRVLARAVEIDTTVAGLLTAAAAEQIDDGATATTWPRRPRPAITRGC